MIYLLIPYDGEVRVFTSFGVMEQVVLQEARSREDHDWCSVFGYELGQDELVPVWLWTVVGPGLRLHRTSPSPSES